MKTLSIVSLSIVVLTGCTHLRMPVPEDLDGNTIVMPVKIKKTWRILDVSRISFGPFTASKIHLGWDKSGTLTADVYSASDFSKRYDFVLTQEDEGTDWKCECKVKANKKELKGELLGGDVYIPIKRKVSLNCTFEGAQGDSNWTLDLSRNETESAIFTGALYQAGDTIRVESVDEIAGQRFNLSHKPSGYVYRRGNTPIGAVDVLDKQRVWITPDSDGNLSSELALASTAVILFQDVLRTVEEVE